jgi:hypothetical protein
MTEEQILKAWSCCLGERKIEDCEKCPLAQGDFEECTKILLNESKTLIDIKNTEVEKLKVEKSVIKCKDCIKDGRFDCFLCQIEKHNLQFINHDSEFYCGFAEAKNETI